MKKRKISNPCMANLLGSLISAINLSSDLTVRILKRVYHLLLIVCRRCDSSCSNELNKLCKLLFDHLQTMFDEFYSCLLNASCEINADLNISLEKLTLLLRCCFVAFESLGDEQGAQLQYGSILLRLLRMIAPVELGNRDGEKFIEFRVVHCHGKVAVPCCSRVSIPSSSFSYFLSILEVFADELVMNISTRKHFMLFDSISDTDFLFSQNYSFASIACVLEIICSHFFLSFFIPKSPKKLNSFHSYLTLESALILLSNPLIFSFPKPYVSHLISLTSDSIPNTQFTNSAYHAYETSLNLYSSQINSLLNRNPAFSFSSNNSFESFLLPSSNSFLPLLTSKPEKIRDLPAINSVRSLFECLKNNLPLPLLQNEKFISSLLTKIARKSSSKSEKILIVIEEEDGAVLASILNLIFSTILHFAKFSCLEKIRRCTILSESVQCVLRYTNKEVTKADPPHGSEFKFLLLHFSSLLPLCYASKIESFVENCLRVVALLCHVVAAEEGDLRGVKSFASKVVDSESARNIHGKFAKVRSRVKEEEMEKSCKGDAYLKCVIGNAAETLPDYEELAEFVECEADKNYASWLQDWGRFRGWKHQKIKYWGTRRKRKLWDAMLQTDNPL